MLTDVFNKVTTRYGPEIKKQDIVSHTKRVKCIIKFLLFVFTRREDENSVELIIIQATSCQIILLYVQNKLQNGRFY